LPFQHTIKHGYREFFIACLLNTVVQHLYPTFGVDIASVV